MAQSKLNDLAGRFGKGGPKGLGTGLKLLAFAGAAGYGITQSMYTGKVHFSTLSIDCAIASVFLVTVEGGHRAIMFSRLGGIKPETYSEGLHLRIPWFQYPIIYDIRYVPQSSSAS